MSKVTKELQKLFTWFKTDQNRRTKLGRNKQMFAFDVSEEQETTKVL